MKMQLKHYMERGSITTPSLWLGKTNFDLTFFHLSGLVCLLLLLPYIFIGDAVIFPIYNFYLIFFGIPHNYLTWATLLPSTSRKTFNMTPIYIAGAICLFIAILVPLTDGNSFNDWILSLISYVSFWHAYRQHHGICKIYDSVQAKRTGDYTIFHDRKFMNIFMALALNGVLVWAFTHPNIKYFLSVNEMYNLIYPVISIEIFYAYLVITFIIGILAFKKGFWDRLKSGKFIPWPQIILMTIAMLTYIVPYFFIPLSAMPLAVAIGTIFHNIQYFGFIWLFEKYRSKELVEANITLQIHQKLVYQKSWVKYFSIALIYSIAMITFYLITPKHIGMTLIYFTALAHYVIDGYMWKKNHNKLLTPVIGRIAAAKYK